MNNNKHSVHWLEDVVQKSFKRQLSRVILTTGKMPSYHIHIGIYLVILGQKSGPRLGPFIELLDRE